MVWIIQPMERKDPETNQGSGKWDLVARSDEGGGFWPALPYPDHPGFDSPEEAAADPEARAIANQTAGFADAPELADPQQLREAIAAVQHDIWAHWMEYQFSKCIQNDDGSLTIPAASVLRWVRQVNLSYAELPENERESDRHQADKVLKVFAEMGAKTNE